MEDKEQEIWKDIPGFEGIYQISNLGNVRRMERMVQGPLSMIKLSQRKVKPCKSSGYYQVMLCNNTRENYHIHKLLAFTFLNLDIKDKTKVVNHIDGSRDNNKLSNLEIISQRENTSHYFTKLENKASKYLGVSYEKNSKSIPKWKASLWYNKRLINLGRYHSEEEAHQAYQNALKEYGIINKYANKSQEIS